MNNKVHDGDDGLEVGEGEKIYPVAMFRQQQKERQRMMIFFIYTAAVVQFVLGVLVMALNIIFIYDGMNSKWYGSRNQEADEEGVMIEITSGLQVPSIGEGILAGFSYMCFAGIAMIVMSKKGNKKALLGVHVCILLLSFTLVITNSCQLGLIHQYATAYNLQDSKWYGEEPRQTSVVSVELLGNFLVMIFSIVALLITPKMKY